ncbi:MAG TPA: hypothetical protein VE035_02470 [Puia sp.]|nr:hypothetical protein [Puia sp.]
MSNERPDDASHWINKLEDPDPPAAEPWTGKNAAWEKLYSRLHEKPRRRIPSWYWAAAACLLLVLYIPVKQAIRGDGGMKMGGQVADAEDGVKPNGSKARGAAKPRGYAKEERKEREGAQSMMTDGARKERTGNDQELATVRIGTNKRRVIVRRMGDEGEKPATKEEAKLAVPEPISGSATTQETRYAPDDLVLGMVIIPPAKKKLRVVHINELDPTGDTSEPGKSNTGVSWAAIPYIQRPVRNVPIFMGNTGKHFFHFGRPKAQVEPSATAATDNIPPELIKIKLSPQN